MFFEYMLDLVAVIGQQSGKLQDIYFDVQQHR